MLCGENRRAADVTGLASEKKKKKISQTPDKDTDECFTETKKEKQKK